MGLIRSGELCLQFGNLSIACGQVILSGVTHRGLGEPGFVVLTSQLCTQVVNLALKLGVLFLCIGTSLNRRTLTCTLTLCGSALELGVQLGKLSIALGNLLCQLLSRSVLLFDKLSIALRLCLLQGSCRARALKLQRSSKSRENSASRTCLTISA